MFTVNELLIATKGKLISGRGNVRVPGVCIDSREIQQNEVFIAIKGNNFDGHDFIPETIKKGAGAIIAEQKAARLACSVNPPLIIVKDSVKALGDIARYSRNKFDIPLIAVTGSNGKTTTKEMISCVLSAGFNVLKNAGTKNNHIGVPLTLVNLSSQHEICVLEIGTNHFKEVSYIAGICNPNIAIITNIGQSHLEHFRNLEGVFKEKISLIKYLRKPFIAILNADDVFFKKEISRKQKNRFILSFGIKEKSDFQAGNIKAGNCQLSFLVNKKYKFTLNTTGYYNVYNALAAIAAGRVFGLEYKDMIPRLSVFNFPSGRLNLIELDNIKFIDDTYNSNPNSLKQALSALENLNTTGRKIFVMGDMLELGSLKNTLHRQAAKIAVKVCDVLITVGGLSRAAAKAARDSGLEAKNIFSCDSSLEARKILFDEVLANSKDIILVKGSRAMKMEEVFKKQG